MIRILRAGLLASVVIVTGCASGLNSLQQREYNQWSHDGTLIEEKDPTTGAILGLLPGGGSFYAREPALGIVNLLFWPLSILWDPISGYDGSKAINYDITQYQRKKDKKKELSILNNKLDSGELSEKEYLKEKHRVDSRYE